MQCPQCQHENSATAKFCEECGQLLRVRCPVGLHSGEVVVRAIGNDLHMDYSASGQTTRRLWYFGASGNWLVRPGRATSDVEKP